MLSQEKFALVDDWDYEELSQYKWHSQKIKNKFYACRRGSERLMQRESRILMHRQIMCASPDVIIDHIDGDTLNNCRENLRRCNASQNCCNRKMNKNNTTGLRGVYWNKKLNKWNASITKNKHLIHIGYFETKEEAGRARDKKAKELHGNFAVLNYPEK